MASVDITDLIITIVEPSVTQSKIIINKLNKIGANKIQYYPTGKLTLDLIKKFPPDLVISAMYLSDMTATDLVQEMRSTPETENIPFMLVTSENSFNALDPIKQAGAVAVLPKPFSSDDLKHALFATADLLSVDDEFIDKFPWEDLDVLVVDDSPMAQKMVCKLLANIGVTQIDLANDGTDAVDFINRKFYDLVITDFNMPEMDGQALITYIRNNSTQQSVPILMITSEQNESRLSAVSKAGVSGICDKPFDPQIFKNLISSFFLDGDIPTSSE